MERTQNNFYAVDFMDLILRLYINLCLSFVTGGKYYLLGL